MSSVAVIIPVYRDADALARTLHDTHFDACRVIVVATVEDRGALAPIRAARPDVIWVESGRGRARQMNAGAGATSAEWLLFLHADTRLPANWCEAIADAERRGSRLGCFRFALDSRRRAARLIEWGVRLRVACFRLPYGDQALFVRRDVFERMGGYADLALMEDVDLVRRAPGPMFCSPLTAVTSARRWEQDGWIRRTAGNVLLLAGYFAGVDPDRLWRLYNTNHADQARARRSQL